MGEYAVLVEKSPALIWAVDRYLTVTLEPAAQWTLQSELWPNTLPFTWQKHQLQGISKTEAPFVYHALTTVLHYLESQSGLPAAAALRITSDLQQQTVKLGLGSSAALTVAIMGALLNHAGISCEQPAGRALLFNLAQSAHEKAQAGGSGADLASAVYGGIIRFSRQAGKNPVLPLNWPENFILAVGWTGKPATTAHFLPRFWAFQSQQPEWFGEFVRHSTETVNLAQQAIQNEDFELLAKCWHHSHAGLVQLNERSQMGFITPTISRGIKLAEQLGLSAKQSGAGGGDCILALCSDPQSQQKLMATWHQQGIQSLALQTGYPRLTG